MHFFTQRDRQRLWKYAKDQSIPWDVYQAACRAVFEAIHAWGAAHSPLLDLRKVAILARHERRVIYILDGRRATLRRPPHGPYIEVWPSGNVTSVGDPRQYAA